MVACGFCTLRTPLFRTTAVSMGRKSNAAAVGAGVLAAAGVMYVVVATAKPRQGSWRYKFKTWLEVKWPLTYRYLELLSPSPPADREEMIAAARETFDVRVSQFTTKGKDVSYEDVPVLMRDGAKVNIRLHIPPAVKARPVPVVYYLHGGGWVVGSSASHHTMAQIMAHDGPFIVATIDYRLAPENKFPVPLNDCMDGLDWLVEQVHKYGGDASKLVVAGDSCGGNLTLAVAKENVKKGDDAIDISGLSTIYPATSCDFDCESYTKYGSGTFPLTTAKMKLFFDCYLANTDTKPADERVSVLLADDFAGLPPTQVISAEWDVLRDDSAGLVEKLKASRVSCTHVHYTRATHGFFPFPTIGSGTDAMREFVGFVREVTAGPTHTVPTTQQTTVFKDLQDE